MNSFIELGPSCKNGQDLATQSRNVNCKPTLDLLKLGWGGGGHLERQDEL